MNNKGFTLIELIATIGLLSVIVIISFVSIYSVIDKNKDNQCESLHKTLKSATKDYFVDNRYGTISNSFSAKVLLDNKYLTKEIINPYTGEKYDADNVKITITYDSNYELTDISLNFNNKELNNCKSS